MIRYNPRYYTLDRLSEEGLFRITRGLKRLMQDYEVSWPLDTYALLEQIRAAGRIPLRIVESDDMPDGLDGLARRDPRDNGYEIHIRPGRDDWKKTSRSRRFNFTLAHELGHVFCGHLDVPEAYRTQAVRDRENLEADEFAGRLLMPAEMILKSRFSSPAALAEAFLVSERACYMRLNNLKRLDLYRAPARAVCPRCGYGEVSPAAKYCAVCGLHLAAGGANGVRVVEYTRPLADPRGRVLFCLRCGNEEFSQEAAYCRICGTPAVNTCLSRDPERPRGHANAPEARFCECCGCGTEYRALGLLRDWRAEKEDYVRTVAGTVK